MSTFFRMTCLLMTVKVRARCLPLASNFLTATHVTYFAPLLGVNYATPGQLITSHTVHIFSV